MANDVTRSMPCNIEAEQYVLGAIIFDNSCISDVVSQLKPDDFYYAANKEKSGYFLPLYNSFEPLSNLPFWQKISSEYNAYHHKARTL